MEFIISSNTVKSSFYSKILMVLLLVIAVWIGTISVAHGNDLYGMIDEPELISVSGSLQDPSSIVVDVIIEGQRRRLERDSALGFLILRSYVVFDENSWWNLRTTDKYKAWKNNLGNNQQPISSPGGSYTFVPGHEPQGSNVKGATCNASNGMNGTCRKNGCIEPPNVLWYCFWLIELTGHKMVKIQGRDGAVIRRWGY